MNSCGRGRMVTLLDNRIFRPCIGKSELPNHERCPLPLLRAGRKVRRVPGRDGAKARGRLPLLGATLGRVRAISPFERPVHGAGGEVGGV